MRVGVWMPLYGRPLVLRAALESFKAMRRRWRNMGIELELCVGWSLPDDLTQVVNYYGYPYASVFAENDPLSYKQEAILDIMRDRFDYYLQIGSDDVFIEEADIYYEEALTRGVQYVGCRSVYFIEPSTQRAVSTAMTHTSVNSVFGAGRIWSAEAMDKVLENGPIWPKAMNNQLDLLSEKQFKAAGVCMETFEEERPFIVDIKSETNIWKFKKYQNERAEDYRDIVGRMDKGARAAVNLLHEVSAGANT